MDETKRSTWQTRLSTAAAFAVILCVLILAGCQTAPKERIVTKVVERRVEVPPSLLACAAEPRISMALAVKLRAMEDAGADVAMFTNQLAQAGQDCRSKLAAVKRLIEAQ